MKSVLLYAVLAVLLGLASCSSESKSWTSRAFHNTAAHFNGYYYAREEVTKIEKTILTSQKDNYNRILLLYPRLDSTLAKGYDKEVQEAVKMASIAIQRHPNSKWVDDCYILVGRARLYSLDWGNAVQTLKYVNTKSKNPDARHLSILYLARTFVEHDEYNNAEAAFDYLAKEKLNKHNQKQFYLEKAHYYQVREDYDNMVRNLTQAAPMLKRKDRPGRIYFILGQVYQRLGFDAEAFNYYKMCLGTNPEYEVDFYARLYMAQVAEISRSKDVASARKSFKKLLKDSKNREFRDKIYYEMSVFEYKQKNITEAIEYYNESIRRSGSSKQVLGEAYLRLGEIYYDTLKKFELSKAYYDSAVTSLPTDYEGYAGIKARQEILDDFVMNLKTIELNDSLLALATLDTAALRKKIATAIDARKPAYSKAKKKKKTRITIQEVSTPLGEPGEFNASAWYFGNPSAVALGQTEFVRVWGNIPLEDNWRRSSRSTARINEPIVEKPQQTAATEVVQAVVAKNPVQEQFEKLYAQIPYTETQQVAAKKKIEDAYFALGDIYNFNLKEPENAILAYETLLNRFPTSEYAPEVLYKLYLLLKDQNPSLATTYANTLTSQYPNTTFAKLLLNPDYLRESGQVLNKQKLIYKEAYAKYEKEEYVEARTLLREALALEATAFTANLELLNCLIIGKTEDEAQYEQSLEQFISLYPDSEVTPYAKKLLETSQNFKSSLEKQRSYSKSLEAPHYFVLVYDTSENLSEDGAVALTRFNTGSFGDLQLKVSTLTLNDTKALLIVSLLPRVSTAIEYYRLFAEKHGTLPEFDNHNFDTFVITKDNFDVFYRTKGLDEYLRFFEKNYHPETP